MPEIHTQSEAICEIQLLRFSQGACNLTSMPSEPQIWENFNTNKWLFVLNQQLLTVTCNKTEVTFRLPYTGILTLQPGCTANTENIILAAEANEKTIYAAFIPEVNLTIPELHLPMLTNIEPTQLKRINLDQFSRLSLQLTEANPQALAEFVPMQQKHFNWRMLLFQIFLFICIITVSYTHLTLPTIYSV